MTKPVARALARDSMLFRKDITICLLSDNDVHVFWQYPSARAFYCDHSLRDLLAYRYVDRGVKALLEAIDGLTLASQNDLLGRTFDERDEMAYTHELFHLVGIRREDVVGSFHEPVERKMPLYYTRPENKRNRSDRDTDRMVRETDRNAERLFERIHDGQIHILRRRRVA